MYYLVTCIRNFDGKEIEEGYNVKLNDENSFTILKSQSFLSDVLLDTEYLAYIGLADHQRLVSNFLVVQIIDTQTLNAESKYILLSNLMQYIGAFCIALWFVKDNAVTPSFGTISSDSKGELPNINRRNAIISNSMGLNESVDFSKEDLREAMKWYEIICDTAIRTNGENISEPANGYHNLSSYLKFDIPSFERARHFLGAARSADFIPSKIANYISVLECLFAVKGENTQKVAERAAFLISNSIEDRIEVFKDVKDAYKVRSSYIHGSEIKNSVHEDLPEHSQKLDNIVRRTLIEMMTNHNDLNYRNKKTATAKNFEGVSDWFDKQMLSKG